MQKKRKITQFILRNETNNKYSYIIRNPLKNRLLNHLQLLVRNDSKKGNKKKTAGDILDKALRA